ncbi:MAG TPA: MATE family efflux transporter [Clostridia bacterium]|nr:MATE family efflux transporter [Clostridia bacterium]
MEMLKPRGFAAFRKKFIGDRAFYAALASLVLPLAIQQGITSFVNLLDNIMVGGLCTESISGVAIVNQMVFVFNLSLFGALSGASIFGAQYAGVNDHEGLRHSFRFKLIVGLIITVLATALFAVFGERLIALYIHDSAASAASPELTMSEAKGYLVIALFGLFPFMVSQCFGSTLREMGETKAPMRASIASILVNFVLNYLLIYGKFGFPNMGVRGAALATVIARFVETAILVAYTYRNSQKHPFIVGALRSLRIPAALVKKILVTGAPLLFNEFFWSTGTALINQCYSYRGLQVVAATNINSTVWMLFAVLMFAMGNAISILCGQKLGAGDIEGARAENTKLIFINVVLHAFIGLVIIASAKLIPMVYNVEDAVRELTSKLLLISGALLWLNSLTHAAYFTIRSGGRTVITFLFDSGFTWVIMLPLAYFLSYKTSLDIVWIILIVSLCDLLKIAIAMPLLVSGYWARNVIK